MQKPPNIAIGTQRHWSDPHGGTSNGEQAPEQSTTSIFPIQNLLYNKIHPTYHMKQWN